MPKIAGVHHLQAIRALQKAGFRVLREGKYTIMTDGERLLTIPRHNPINAFTMGGIDQRRRTHFGGVSAADLVTPDFTASTRR